MKFKTFDREQFARLADGLAVALAVTLPWSTSATGIFAVLLLLAMIPAIDPSALRRIVSSPAGGIPLILVALGAAGMFWADVSWLERFDGLSSFFKLLFLPLLLHQFSRSDRACHVLIGFLSSCLLLLAASWALAAWPEMPWFRPAATRGIPVKDYISQGAMFTVCVFIMAQFAARVWRDGRRVLALALGGLALIFLANVFYLATSRTALVVILILAIVFGYRQFGWKGATGLLAGFFLLAAAAWPSASYLRTRVSTLFTEIEAYKPGAEKTSAGERLTFWTKSVQFVEDAPVFGHGTGSIREQFRRSAVGQTGMAAQVAANPHNQMLAVGIQLGLAGIAVLLAMWLAHLTLFRSNSVAAWTGLIVVVQNIVGSQFNSHLFDFTHGWLYVVGVGVAGGMVLREQAAKAGHL